MLILISVTPERTPPLLGKLELAKFSGDLYPTIANYTQKMPRLAEALKTLVL
jgi:hypothetical protein